jgi:tetratricopeptide (TPR) repeat protein
MIKGVYYQNTNRSSEALRFFDQAIVKDYNFLDAHMFKGQLLYNEKRYNEALRAFRLVTSISPTYPDAYYWLGKTGEAMNDPAEAKLNYERAAALEKTLATDEK